MTKKYYTNRQYRIAAGLLLALSAPALAQVPPLNLPALPLPPGASNPASGSDAATPANLPPPLALPQAKESEHKTAKSDAPKAINPAEMLPAELLEESDNAAKPPATDNADNSADEAEQDTADADDTTNPPAPAPTPNAQATATAEGNVGPPPPLPFGGLPTPANTNAAANAPTGGGFTGPQLPGDINLSELAGDSVAEVERKDLKSWEKPLAPARTYPSTKFNYKRVVLPASVYRTRYPVGNGHLPKRLTREDLDKAFLIAVAKNDVNGTRALLNSGRNVNQMNAFGDSALIVAVRAGAFDTARLLVARGANTGFYGQGGKTAFHYARQWKNNDLAKMLIRGS